MYSVSLGLGLLVGILYGLIGIRSPAPPIIALLGLLGIVLGEQIPPLARCLFSDTNTVDCVKSVQRSLSDNDASLEKDQAQSVLPPKDG